MKPVLPPQAARDTLVPERPRPSPRIVSPNVTGMSVVGVVDLFYSGNNEFPAIGRTLSTLLESGDVNGDGRANASDDGTPEWLDVNLRDVDAGVYRQLERFVRAYDYDGSNDLNRTEQMELRAGLDRIIRDYPQFGQADPLYVLTEARMSNADRRVDTEQLIATFGEMLEVGLPESAPATPSQGTSQRQR